MTLEQLNICATFFGALVALIIFNQWRNQKGSEVLSSKCEELLLDINIFYEKLFNNYILFISCITSNNDSEEFWNTRNDFGKTYVKIKNNLNIVCLYKDEKNLKYIDEKITYIYEKYENLVFSIAENEGELSSNDFKEYNQNNSNIYSKYTPIDEEIKNNEPKINKILISYIFYKGKVSKKA